MGTLTSADELPAGEPTATIQESINKALSVGGVQYVSDLIDRLTREGFREVDVRAALLPLIRNGSIEMGSDRTLTWRR
jgi:DNA-binding transcriptional regulator PaaX